MARSGTARPLEIRHDAPHSDIQAFLLNHAAPAAAVWFIPRLPSRVQDHGPGSVRGVPSTASGWSARNPVR